MISTCGPCFFVLTFTIAAGAAELDDCLGAAEWNSELCGVVQVDSNAYLELLQREAYKISNKIATAKHTIQLETSAAVKGSAVTEVEVPEKNEALNVELLQTSVTKDRQTEAGDDSGNNSHSMEAETMASIVAQLKAQEAKIHKLFSIIEAQGAKIEHQDAQIQNMSSTIEDQRAQIEEVKADPIISNGRWEIPRCRNTGREGSRNGGLMGTGPYTSLDVWCPGGNNVNHVNENVDGAAGYTYPNVMANLETRSAPYECTSASDCGGGLSCLDKQGRVKETCSPGWCTCQVDLRSDPK